MPYEKIGKNEPVCIVDEVPFEIPDSWEWVRLKTFASVFGGKRIPAGRKLTTTNTGHKYIRVSDMKNNSVLTDNLLYVPDDVFPTISRYIIKKEDLYITVAGTIGAVGKIPPELDGANLTENADRLVFSIIDQDWLMQCLSSSLVQNQIADATTKVGQPKLAIMRIEELLIALPPLNEQKRILKMLNALSPYISQYGDKECVINNLNKAFPDILKKSILQQAIMGKLVPQDENDEPASVLLEKIREEKATLIKAGKLKKDKHESIIYHRDNSHYEKLDGVERCIDDEVPFEIPDSWCWCRLGELGETNIGLTYRPSDKITSQGILVLRSSNIQDGNMDYNDCIYVSCNVPERAMINKGDILICARNGSRSLVGKCAIVDRDGMAFGAFMAKFTSEFNPYIKLFLDSPIFRGQLDGVKTETINQITQDMLKRQLIPLPPIKEQERIIRKTEKTMKSMSRL